MKYHKMDFFLDMLFVLVVVGAIFGLFALMDDTKGALLQKPQVKEVVK